uniref:Major facilitator superfamily (MFS) profile domain-containing protein n=1 Tax=Graphocephala atropunctata TaxID=36148 RepID=A0A1B6L1E3_9HEMI
MTSTKKGPAEADLPELKALVEESLSPQLQEKTTEESISCERVGGESWYGSLAVLPPSSKHRLGSPLKQVAVSLFANLGTINSGMMFGFSAVTIPQLKQPDSFIQITPSEASWIASLPTIATPFGCLLSGYFLDTLGRKRTIILCLMPMIVGWYLISAASAVHMIYAGRLCVGLGAGMVGSPVRVYTGEVTQPHLRGMLAAIAAVGASTGVFTQYIIGTFFPWYFLAFFNGCVVSVALISAFFLPESPQFLINKGRIGEARAALTKLRGASADVDEEVQRLVDFANKTNAKSNEKANGIRDIFKPSTLKPFAILAVYFLLYQFSGVNPLTFYAVEIIQESGANMNTYAATIILGLVRLGFTIVSCILMRRLGRRPMTFISSVGCGVTMIGLGSYMYLGERWASEGKEKVATWFPVLNLFLFMTASTMGYLTVPWVMISEVYPSKVRGIMGGLTTFVAHFSIFLVVKSFPILQSISKFGTFILYGSISLLATIFFYCFLPETQGRTLQEIEDYFSGRTKTLGPPKKDSTNNNVKTPIVKRPI